jgi:uncharacterized protein
LSSQPGLGRAARCGPAAVYAARRVCHRASVGAEQFGRFLIAIFDEWVRRDVGNVFVQTFGAGKPAGPTQSLHISPTCGEALALEHNGDLYSSDHYVEPGYLLGNILQTPMAVG